MHLIQPENHVVRPTFPSCPISWQPNSPLCYRPFPCIPKPIAKKFPRVWTTYDDRQ